MGHVTITLVLPPQVCIGETTGLSKVDLRFSIWIRSVEGEREVQVNKLSLLVVSRAWSDVKLEHHFTVKMTQTCLTTL